MYTKTVRPISIVIIASLLLVPMFGFKACKKVSPSTEIQVARAFANVPLTAKTLRDITDVLLNEGGINAEAKAKINALLNKTVDVTDHLAGDVQAGHFDPQAWDVALTNLADDWVAISALFASNLDPRINEWVSLAKYLIPLIKSLVDKLNPPAPPALPTITAEGIAKNRISVGGIAAIIAISVQSAIKYLAVQQDDSLDSLWNRYHEYSAAFHGV